MLAGCATDGIETATVVPTETAAKTVSLPTETLVSEIAPEPTPTVDNVLDLQASFEVIAAVHAYVLQVDDWAGQGLSLFERQAVLQPVLELGMGPLNQILMSYTPKSELAGDWEAASEVYAQFYPLALDWAEGGIDDAVFFQAMADIRASSDQMIGSAEKHTAAMGYGFNYGSGYIGALGVVFTLYPEPDGPVEESLAADEVPLEPTPNLLAVEVVPFLYPFAGSDIFLVIGQVEHIDLRPLRDVEVEVLFYNFLDEHLGTVRGRLLAGTANPGEAYPFSASTVTEGEEAALKDWTRYEVVVYARPAESEGYQDFELVTTAATQDGSGRYLIEGELTNTGDLAVPADHVRVGVTAFDSLGSLVGIGDGLALGADPIPPGGVVPFTAVIEAVSGDPADFQFFAEYLPED